MPVKCHLRFWIVFAALAPMFLTACSEKPEYLHTYTTRGVILSLPGERVTQEFIVHHEEIPEYVSINGSIGMNEMAMPIPVPDPSILEGIEIGDKVELVFGERFEPDHTMGLVSITKLADDVELNLGKTSSGQKRSSDTPHDSEAEGFVPIFDGKSLDGWDGDMRYWSVENGAIVGQFSEANPLAANTFLIWRGGDGDESGGILGDFELKFEYRISEGGNSGVQYRSEETGDFGMKGYQADIHHGPRWTGICYDEHGRGVLADRGQSVVVESEDRRLIVDRFGEREALMMWIDHEDWNEYHIAAYGNRLLHKINGVRMSEVVDLDNANREQDGKIGLQIHRAVPARVEFKNIEIKRRDAVKRSLPAGPMELTDLVGIWDSTSITPGGDFQVWGEVDRLRLVVEEAETTSNPYGDGLYNVALFEKRTGEDTWARTADSQPGGVTISDAGQVMLRLGPIGSHILIEVVATEEGVELHHSGSVANVVRICD
jgi:hypothetical protein